MEESPGELSCKGRSQVMPQATEGPGDTEYPHVTV